MRRWQLALPALLICIDTADATPMAPDIIPLASYQGKQFTVQASVNGHLHTFLFDTGEGVSMISLSVAADAGCHPWAVVTGFRMLGERIDAPRCDAISFTLPHRMLKPLETIVYDLDAIAGSGAPKLDGAIGLDAFAGQVITICLAADQIIVETPESLAGRITHAIEVPIRIVRDAEGAALSVDIGVDTPAGLAWMELDTGNSGPTIFVSPSVAPLLKLDAAAKSPKDAARQAVVLSIAHKIHWSGEARVFENMIMDGNIGTQLLKNHDITLDLKSGRAWLSP